MVESTKKVQAQNISCPEVVWTTPNPMDLGCDIADTCFTLNASLPDIRQTLNGPNAYVVNEIPYSGNFGYNLAGATNVLVNIDDKFSSAVNLPFPFCFYGTTYHQIVIGANGRVTFDMSRANMTDQWSIGTNASLPSLNAPFTRATIYGPFHDMDPSIYSSNKTINWKVIDEAPCRKMIITYRDIPHFGTFCTNSRSTFQIVLYENTNAIEIYIDEKPACTGWNNGRSIIGIQNWQGTQATVVPNQNPGVQSLNQKAYRFVPNGTSLLSGNIELLDFNDNVIQSVPNPGGANGEINLSFSNVCYDLNGPGNQEFKVRATYQACSGNDITVLDTLAVTKPNLVPDPIATTPITYCIGATSDSLMATALPGHDLQWYDENQNLITSPVYPETNQVGFSTYYVSQSSDNCESNLVPIEVEILQNEEQDIILSFCRAQLPLDTLGQTILANQQTNLTTPLTTIIIPGTTGCDTITTYFLNVIENDTTTIEEVICQNELPYQFYNQSIQNAGIYNHILTSLNGCDSIISLNLIVNPIQETAIEVSICENETYLFGGQTLSGAGTYTDTLLAMDGCDSIVILVLSVNPVEETTLYKMICPGTTFSFGGQSLGVAGTYYDTLETIAGCDSVIILLLTIDDYITNTFEHTLCEGESLLFNGVTYTSPVTLQDNITDTFSTAGCDSIVTLVLNVNPVGATTINESICINEVFSFGGQTLTSAGTYYDTLQTLSGCDSIITLNLSINPYINTTLNVEICEGESHVFNGQTYTTAVSLQDNITDTFSTSSCDSIVTLVLDVNPNESTLINEMICPGASFSFGGQALTSAGTYYDTLQTFKGCDSLITLNLSVDDYLNSTLEVAICDGESYVFNGQTYTTTVTLQDNITDTFSTSGCDSIVTLILDVNPHESSTIQATICENEPFYFGGQNLSVTGIYTDTLMTSLGCDSVVTLELNVNPVAATILNESICMNETFSFAGQTLSTTGTYYDTLQTSKGCDSIITLNLIVDSYIHTTLEVDICEGGSYVFNGQAYTTAVSLQDNITDTFSTSNCDSIVTLILDVHPIQTTTVQESICINSSYSFGGQTLTSAGTYYDTLVASTGCDSMVTLILEIDPYITNTLEVAICEGESYVFNGQAYSSPIAFQDHITDTFSTASCDSIVTLVLNVNPNFQEEETLILCASELPFMWNGITIPVGAITQQKFDSLTNVTTLGCDSITYLNLVIQDTFQFYDTITICEVDLPYTWHQFTFDTQTPTGTILESANYLTSEGCDSSYYLTLNIAETYEMVQDTTICRASLPFTWHGYTFLDETSLSSNPEVLYLTSNGCDSTITLNVDLYADVDFISISDEGCGVVVFEGNNYYQSTIFTDTLYNHAGCDSLIRDIDLAVYPAHDNYEIIDLFSCDTLVHERHTYYSSTQLLDTFYSVHGCDSLIKEVNINIHHFELELTTTYDTIFRGESVYLDTYGSTAYNVLSWTPTSLFPFQNATGQHLSLDDHAQIEVVAKSVDGCQDTASLFLYVKYLDKKVFVPNSFTPNGDGLNDLFGPELPIDRGYEIENFSIYNRYGERVFFNEGSENIKWDGRLRGKPMDMGVYFYVLVVTFLDGDTFEDKGEVNLLR